MKIIVIDDKGVATEAEVAEKEAFMLRVAKRLIEKKDEPDKTLAEAICHLARLGAANTPRFIF